MSLLLEALKKAEKAKEEAQRRTNGAPAPSSSAAAGDAAQARLQARAELSLQDDAPQPAEGKPVVTRAELPDISPSLEILSDDIASPKGPSASSPSARRTPAREPETSARRPSAPGVDRSADQASAKKVFQAKFKEPNPRLPFYLTMGTLGVAVVCTVAYFWYQLRPPAALVNTNPPASTSVAVAPASPASTPISTAPASPAGPSAIPGLPGAASHPSVPPASATPSATPPRTSSPTPAVPHPSSVTPAELVARSAPPVRPAAPRAAIRPSQPEAITPVASRPTPQVLPKVESGYEAFTAGDLVRSRTDYEDALREEPDNRDALLGLAAVETRSGHFEGAEALYLKLLRADPRDANAQAGLIALRGARMDPLVTESRVKSLLAADPQANVLHFTLGNQYAQQGRWAEAQQEYFKAFTAEPENADFAYNLAVSLDHLRQNKLALEYYQRALSLGATRAGSFDPAAARARIAQLGG